MCLYILKPKTLEKYWIWIKSFSSDFSKYSAHLIEFKWQRWKSDECKFSVQSNLDEGLSLAGRWKNGSLGEPTELCHVSGGQNWQASGKKGKKFICFDSGPAELEMRSGNKEDIFHNQPPTWKHTNHVWAGAVRLSVLIVSIKKYDEGKWFESESDSQVYTCRVKLTQLRNWVTTRRKEEKSLQWDSSDESYVWKLVWAEGSGLGWWWVGWWAGW